MASERVACVPAWRARSYGRYRGPERHAGCRYAPLGAATRSDLQRTRIASDLHDDLGSSLSQISILSEVVRTHLGTPDPQIADPLARIGTLSRESVDSMMPTFRDTSWRNECAYMIRWVT